MEVSIIWVRKRIFIEYRPEDYEGIYSNDEDLILKQDDIHRLHKTMLRSHYNRPYYWKRFKHYHGTTRIPQDHPMVLEVLLCQRN
jgi:hypothetical protein